MNAEKGITIILTTHYMDEADRLCDRVAIIDKGRIVASDTPEKLKEEIGGDVITIKSAGRDELCAKLKTLPWVNRVDPHDGFITINLPSAEKHVAQIVSLLAINGIEIDSISIRKPTLEDVFLHFTGRTIREEEASSIEQMRMMHQRFRRR